MNANSKLNSNKKENHHAHKKNDKTLTFNDLESEVDFIDFTDNSKVHTEINQKVQFRKK